MARRRLLSDLWATYKDNVKQEEKISLEMFSEDGGTTGLSGTSQIVYIESSGPWERSGDTLTWITLTPSSGKGGETKVTVSADEAPSTQDRDGEVIISSQSTLEQLKIEVSQQGIQDFIKVEEIDGPYDSLDEGSSTYHADWCESGEVKSIKLCYPKDSVTSSSATVGIYDIKVSTVDSASSEFYDYVTYSFKWASGETGTAHWHKYITFVTINGASFTYNVYQDPKSFISVSTPATTNVAYSGTTGSISYKTHNPAGLDEEYPSVTHPKVIVSADTYNAVLFGTSSSNCSSTTVTLSDKEGILYYKVLARDNQAFSDRNIKVTFTCEDYSATGDCANPSGYTDFTLSQGGYPYIGMNPNRKSVGANASSFTLSVSSNTSWTLSENSDWISSLSKTSGNSGLTSGIVCKYNENTNVATSRKGTITGRSDELTSVSATCVVTQSAATPYIYINGSTNGAASVSNSATSYSITIESNDDWTLSVDNGAGLTPYVGTGDSSSTINFQKNTDSEAKKYIITATTTYGASATFTLNQKGALWLIPSYSAGAIVSSADTSDSAQQSITIRVPSGETSVQVSFSSSGAWSKVAYGDTVNWCSANTTNGANGTVVTYTISANDSIEERTTESAFTYNLSSQVTSDYEYSVIFIQEGQDPYLNLKSGSTVVTEGTVKGAGRTITITADTNCTWGVYDYTQGLTVTPSGNNTRSGGTIKINVPATTIISTGIAVTYVVTIKTNDSAIETSEQITKTYTIKQGGIAPYVMFVDDPYSVTADTTTTVTGYVSANTPWRITVDGTYVTGVSPETGSTGVSEVDFTVAQYTATTSTTASQDVASSLFPTGANDSANIIIGAFSPELSCPSAVYIPFAATSNTITVMANAAWEITASGDFTTSTTTGGAQGDLRKTTFSVKSSISNTGLADKLLGSFTVKLTNYSPSQTVNVYKKCEQKTTLIVTPTQLGSSGGKLSIEVTTTEGTGTLYIGGPVTSSTSSDVSTGSFSFSEISTTINGSKTYLYTITTKNTSTTTYNIYCVKLVLDNGSVYYCQVPQNPESLQISVEPTDVSVSWKGDTVSATISTNDPKGWKITSISNRQMISSPSLSTTGQDGLTLAVVVEPTYSPSGTNSGYITFGCVSDTSITATLTLTQELDNNHWVPTVYIDWKYDTVSYSTTANTLYYTANTNFSVTCTGGTNFSTTDNVSVGGKLLSTTTGSITISGFGTNTSVSDRVFWASISVDLDGYSTSDMIIGTDVSFTQKGFSPYISLNKSTIQITSPQSGSTDVYVTASGSWTASTSNGIALYPSSGTGDSSVKIEYVSNDSTEVRPTSSITFTLTDYPTYTADLSLEGTSSSSGIVITTSGYYESVFTQGSDGYWAYSWKTSDTSLVIPSHHAFTLTSGSWSKSFYGTGGTGSLGIRTNLGTSIDVETDSVHIEWNNGFLNGIVYVYYLEYTQTITPYIPLTPTLSMSTVREIGYDDTVITISVSSNTSWTIGLSDSSYTPTDYATNLPGGPSPSSITGSGNDTKTFTVPQNYSALTFTSEKTFCFTGITTYGKATLGVPEATASTIVGQEGCDNRITPTITVTSFATIVSGRASFSAEVKCTENIPWKANVTTINGTVLGITGDTGTGGGTIELDVSGYTATTYYTITVTTTADSSVVVKNVSDSCTVQQGPASTIKNHLEGDTTIEADETGTTITVVTTNDSVTWTLDGGGLTPTPINPSGLVISSSFELSDSNNSDLILGKIALGATLSPSAGTGTTYVLAKIPTSETSVTITAAFVGGTPGSDTLTITRKGTLKLTGLSSVGSGVTSTTLTITTVNATDTWTLSSSDSWCTLSQASGTGGKSVTVTFSANTATVARSTTFTLTSNGNSVTLTLTQDKGAVKIYVTVTFTFYQVKYGEFAILAQLNAYTTTAVVQSIDLPSTFNFTVTAGVSGGIGGVPFTNRTTQVTYDGGTFYEIYTHTTESATENVSLYVTGVVCNSLPSGYEYSDENEYPMIRHFQ